MATDSQHERKLLNSQLKEEYANVVYSHEAHEEQRTLLAKHEKTIKTWQIVLSALSMTGAIGVLTKGQWWASTPTVLLTFVLLALNLYGFRFDIGTQITNHQKAADQLWLLTRKYLNLLTDFESLSTEEIRKRRDILLSETNALYSSIPRTSYKSFKIAQRRLKEEGLKQYTRDELDKILPIELRDRDI